MGAAGGDASHTRQRADGRQYPFHRGAIKGLVEVNGDLVEECWMIHDRGVSLMLDGSCLRSTGDGVSFRRTRSCADEREELEVDRECGRNLGVWKRTLPSGR